MRQEERFEQAPLPASPDHLRRPESGHGPDLAEGDGASSLLERMSQDQFQSMYAGIGKVAEQMLPRQSKRRAG